MKVIIEGQLLSTYKNPDFKDKDTGEVSEGKNKVQLLVETKLSNGSVKHEMQDISIPDSKVAEYKSKVGQKIQLQCNYMSQSTVNFYVKD